MQEVIFLSALASIWLIFATIQDIKKREVANWLNFSLIIFALGFRFFYSLFSSENFNFFYQGLIGLGIFLIIGNILYYGRMFAGGDAKLMIALGTVLPFSDNFSYNVKIFAGFLLLFLFSGAIYGLSVTIALSVKRFSQFKKEFFKETKQNKKIIFIALGIGIIMTASSQIERLFFILGILVFILPFIYFYAKSVDEVCMIKKIKTKNLTEGDWLYKELRIGRKVIKPKWEGLSKKEIKIIQRAYKQIEIREGIPFVPVFFISFIILIGLYFSGIFDLLFMFF